MTEMMLALCVVITLGTLSISLGIRDLARAVRELKEEEKGDD